MPRHYVLAIAFATACTGTAFQPAPLPPLSAAEQPIKPLVAAARVGFVSGEHLAYGVRVHGIEVGRLDIETGASEVISKFKTTLLTSAFTAVTDDMVTQLAPDGSPGATTETLLVGEDAKTFNLDATGQSVHAVLATIRAWASPDAAPGFALISAAGNAFRLELSRPIVEDLQGTHALRIDGRVRMPTSAQRPVGVVMWLADGDHRPLRVEISHDDVHVVADLVHE